jgi:NADPH:quinone reductase-like Zn-dependent oxidoreductase
VKLVFLLHKWKLLRKYTIKTLPRAKGGSGTMTTTQSIRVHAYGGPEQLKIEQATLPQPQAGEVLVRVLSAGVNPVDWKIRQGYLKDFRPMQFPYTPGADIAGIVEEVGPGVTTFHKGQAVFGQSSSGAYAEYAIASVNVLAAKPESISFDEAAAIPIGATTAWQGLFDQGGLQAGQHVLIEGASGGVGLFAVQFARWKGAHVIGTTSTANVETIRELGAEQVIDYKKTQVESVVKDVDLVFDTVGGETLERAYGLLKRGGILATIAGAPSQEKEKQFGIRTAWFSAQTSSQLLQQFAQLIVEGQVKVFIQKTFPLHEAKQAHETSQSGHGLGRIVLHIANA